MQYERNRAGELRIRGAGPTLAYEIVEPTTGSQSASALTCLCLHGNSSHRGIWRLVARGLPEYRCVLLDFRGHGESEHAAPPAYNPEHHAEDLVEVIPPLVQGQYAILAHSEVSPLIADATAAGRSRQAASLPDPLQKHSRSRLAFPFGDVVAILHGVDLHPIMSPGAPTFPARHHADAARPRPAVPHRPGWIYEEKVDGWRMLALKDRGRVRLVSRQGVDHTARSVDLAVAVTRLPA